MDKSTTLQKILSFFLTKIIIGLLVVGGSVALTEAAGRFLLDKTPINDELKNAIIGITEVTIALLSYVFLFRWYERRQIKELSRTTFWANAFIGFFAGLILQSLAILVIYLAGGYSIIRVHPVSFLLPGFNSAVTAGFVAEIVIRGIIFRVTEEKWGIVIALIVSVLLFAVPHSAVKGATLLSVISPAVQAGFLFSAGYLFSRSLWLPIFLHFAWDFAEPGIYGAINPGITIEKSLFTSKITGSEFLTGGPFGPGNSIQAIICCFIAGLLFLSLAKRKNNFVNLKWRQ